MLLRPLRGAVRFLWVPVVTLADSLYHRLQIPYLFGDTCETRKTRDLSSRACRRISLAGVTSEGTKLILRISRNALNSQG
jgi:hypothetical protein